MKNKYLTLLAASSFAFFMQACGDDSSSSASDDDKEDSKKTSEVYVVGVAADYSAGELRWIEDGKISEKSLETMSDAKVVVAGSNLFLLERYGSDNLLVIDAEDKSVAKTIKLDDASNPADVVMADKENAWVALEGADSLVKINVADGKIVKSVKTADFASEGATSPNLVDLEVSGDTLFAVFQRYSTDENWVTTYPKGLLALYSLDKGELLDTVQLATANPMSVEVVNGNVYVATHAGYNADYGADADDKRGIEKVDLKKLSSKLVISGKDLGGGVITLVTEGDVAYAAVRGAAYGASSLVSVDLEKASVKTVKDIDNVEGGIAFDAVTGVLYVGSRAYGDEVLYSYDGEEVSKVETADEKTLPPYSIAVK